MSARALVVAGLGYGDEGKGRVVDHLTRTQGADWVVRYNGGAQAAHHVVLPDGRWHKFAQFGAGTLAGARTFLSRFMMVNPHNLLTEAEALERLGVSRPLDLITIASLAPITTPWHVAQNRAKAASDGTNMTCGLGIGETAQDVVNGDALLAGDLYAPDLEERLEAVRDRGDMEVEINATVAEVADFYREFVRVVDIADWMPRGTVIFEGAQGVLLDESYGFHPYTTWSDCTFGNADALLWDWSVEDVTRIGVTRAYATRHGDGPFVTEHYRLGLADPVDHNGDDGYQGLFRVGYTDLLALRYALDVLGGVDYLAVTCLDRLPPGPWKVCSGYRDGPLVVPEIERPERPDLAMMEWQGKRFMECNPIYDDIEPADLCGVLEEALGVRVGLRTYGAEAARMAPGDVRALA